MPRTKEHASRWSEAQRLRHVRRTLGMTQRELADQFRVMASTIALWESGTRTVPGPALRLLELYEEELGIATDRGPDDKATLEALTTSRWARSLAVSRSLASGVATLTGAALKDIMSGQERPGQVRLAAQVAVARRFVDSMGELKALSMKFGQMIGYLDFAMPPAAREAFIVLQTQSTPMSSEAVLEVFLDDVGKAPQDLFAAWDPTPIAAASIGQVHRARMRSGQEVAVKVQYPGIQQALRSDLRTIKLADRTMALFFPNQDKGTVYAELSERILEECDYRLEAERQTYFHELLRGRDGMYVPRVFPTPSSSRILVSEFIEGKTFSEFVAEADQAARNRAGERIYRMAFESILKHGMFNADPHPGNYLFRGEQVVFLDFGCVKTYSPEFITLWKRHIRATLEDDRQSLATVAAQLGFVKDPRRYNFDHHRKMMHTIYACCLEDREYQFTSDHARESWRQLISENPTKHAMNLPREWVWPNRLQWGLYAVLALLGARANFRRLLLDLLYAPGEPQPAGLSSPRSHAEPLASTAP